MAGHVVTGACVITKRPDGSDLHLYAGDVLPEHIDKDEIKRLTDLGLVGAEKSAK